MSGYITIKLRRGTASQWTSSNPILADGEVGLETDTRKFKVGNGTGQWTSLSYWGGSGGGASAFVDLTDVPSSYSGQGGKGVRVKADASGLEFYSLTIAAGDLPTGIDAAKIADGTVSNAEFQRLNGVTSPIQDQLDGKQAAGNYFNKSSDDADDITAGATNKFATQSEKDKLSNISITQPVDLDAIESRVNELDAAVILKGTWDASAGTFAGGGIAQAGWSYIVSVAGTVDGISFSVNDRLIAITDNASTSAYASNWFKADYTDLVTSVDGATGAVTVGAIIAAANTKDAIADTDVFGFSDSESSNATKKTAWSNIKSKLNTYLANIYQTILVSGTNIKTVNSTSLLGSGDVAVQATLVSGTNIKSVNGNSLLGSGDLTIGGGGFYDPTYWEYYDHFHHTANISGYNYTISNSGTGSGGSSQASEVDHPGVWRVSTGTTSTGFANLNHVQSTSWFYFNDGAITFEAWVKLPSTLSDGTDNYIVRSGLGQSTSGDGNNGAFFKYNHALNSGNWTFVMRAAGADVLSINTSTAAQANTWVRLKFTIAASTQAAEVFINGTSVGSGTPSSTIGSQLVGLMHQVVKSAGTTTEHFYIDSLYIKQVF